MVESGLRIQSSSSVELCLLCRDNAEGALLHGLCRGCLFEQFCRESSGNVLSCSDQMGTESQRMSSRDAAVIASQRARRSRQIILTMGCLLGALLVLLVGVRLRDWSAKSPEPERQSIDIPSVATAASDATGTTAIPAEPLAGTASSTSKTPQPLLLISTSRGSTPRSGTARIGGSARNPQTYVAGALLVNGARLIEIHDQYVVVERAGQQAKLYLASLGSRSKSQLLNVGGEVLQAKPAPAHYTEVVALYLRPSPLYEGDVLKGYEVYPGPRRDVFTQIGLHSGDLILTLQGQPLGDPQQAMALFKQLTSGTSVVAMIEREGKAVRVMLDGSAIAKDQANELLQ